MDVLLLISTRESGKVAAGLAGALQRAGTGWGCFFTNDGVELLRDADFVSRLASAQRAVACEHSWDKVSSEACPVERGSQTISSAMMADAARVVSL